MDARAMDEHHDAGSRGTGRDGPPAGRPLPARTPPRGMRDGFRPRAALDLRASDCDEYEPDAVPGEAQIRASRRPW
jgi:hypothetical protein